jgi:hypothetical protein
MVIPYEYYVPAESRMIMGGAGESLAVVATNIKVLVSFAASTTQIYTHCIYRHSPHKSFAYYAWFALVKLGLALL